MIEITESKLHSLVEHAENGLRHMGKLLQLIDEIKDDYSDHGAYGERGRLGMRGEWEEDRFRYNERYGNRTRR